MATEKKCVKCGSASLEPGAIQSTGRIHFRPENTKLLTFKTGDVAIKATICLECGFIELIGDFKKAQRLTR